MEGDSRKNNEHLEAVKTVEQWGYQWGKQSWRHFDVGTSVFAIVIIVYDYL